LDYPRHGFDDEELDYREWLVERIEGIVGTTGAWSPELGGLFDLDTKSLEKLYVNLRRWGETESPREAFRSWRDYKKKHWKGLD